MHRQKEGLKPFFAVMNAVRSTPTWIRIAIVALVVSALVVSRWF
jgi:hypothetical protein